MSLFDFILLLIAKSPCSTLIHPFSFLTPFKCSQTLSSSSPFSRALISPLYSCTPINLLPLIRAVQQLCQQLPPVPVPLTSSTKCWSLAGAAASCSEGCSAPSPRELCFPSPLTPPNAKSKSVFLLLAAWRIISPLVSFGEEWLCTDNNNFHFPIQNLLFYLWVTDWVLRTLPLSFLPYNKHQHISASVELSKWARCTFEWILIQTLYGWKHLSA